MPRKTSVLPVAWDALLRLVYPPCCVGCGALLAQAADLLCPRCIRLLERPSAEAVTDLLARLPHEALDGAMSLWYFDTGGVVQRVQHRLKYGNRPYVGLILGRWLGDAYRASGLPLPDLVLPIPLHRSRQLERGYNQSAMLAGGVSQVLALPLHEQALVRVRATRSQTRLSRTRRWQNVADAFALPDPHRIEGQSVLLIDDVLTTGATLVAAGSALKEVGAAAVYAATLALARS